MPTQAGNRPLHHAIEARHPGFADPEFARLCAAQNAAILRACGGEHSEVDAETADFGHLRLMGTAPDHPPGYASAAPDGWADMLSLTAARSDVSGFKERNPAAAMAPIERLGQWPG